MYLYCSDSSDRLSPLLEVGQIHKINPVVQINAGGKPVTAQPWQPVSTSLKWTEGQVSLFQLCPKTQQHTATKRPLEGFSLGPKTWICGVISEISCKNPRPNPSETGMGPHSILKDISLPCRSTHPSPHLVGIRARLQAEGRHIPLACQNTKSWISPGRNKSYSHFLPLLTVNAENKICFVMSLRWALIEFLLILIECWC